MKLKDKQAIRSVEGYFEDLELWVSLMHLKKAGRMGDRRYSKLLQRVD
jgi:hypothetical protein